MFETFGECIMNIPTSTTKLLKLYLLLQVKFHALTKIILQIKVTFDY